MSDLLTMTKASLVAAITAEVTPLASRVRELEAELDNVKLGASMLQAADVIQQRHIAQLEARCREQLKALHQVRDFEPVVNGEYAVMEAIPAMRKIAIEAIAASASETPAEPKLFTQQHETFQGEIGWVWHQSCPCARCYPL